KAAGSTDSPPLKDRYELPFPLHLSRVRTEAERQRASSPAEKSSAAVSLKTAESRLPTDRLPALTPQMTAALMETGLAATLDGLRQLDVTAVGLLGTDKRDLLFIAQEIQRQPSNLFLFLLGGSLMYVHTDYPSFVRGELVVLQYPLNGLTQLPTTGDGLQGRRFLRQFPDAGAEGTFHAFLALMSRPEKMLDYGEGCHGDRVDLCGPSVWLSMVGREQAWPL